MLIAAVDGRRIPAGQPLPDFRHLSDARILSNSTYRLRVRIWIRTCEGQRHAVVNIDTAGLPLIEETVAIGVLVPAPEHQVCARRGPDGEPDEVVPQVVRERVGEGIGSEALSMWGSLSVALGPDDRNFHCLAEDRISDLNDRERTPNMPSGNVPGYASAVRRIPHRSKVLGCC